MRYNLSAQSDCHAHLRFVSQSGNEGYVDFCLAVVSLPNELIGSSPIRIQVFKLAGKYSNDIESSKCDG